MKEKVLTFLKDKTGNYVSGEIISEALGVTRASVWKTINQLRQEGYPIESVTSKGYKLTGISGVFNSQEISSRLDHLSIWNRVHYFQSLTSTNDYAKELAQSLDSKAAVIVADVQTKGRGRLGRSWESPSGTGLWMSLLIKPSFAPVHASKLTQLAALAVSRVIEGQYGIENAIKWPNDIHVKDKKICGILTEMSAELSHINYLVIGIGVNVNTVDFPDTLIGTATSLYLETKCLSDRTVLIEAIIEEFETLYAEFEQCLSLEGVRGELKRRSNIIGNQVMIQHNNQQLTALAVDIDSEGNLMVDYNGKLMPIFYGEVERVRKL